MQMRPAGRGANMTHDLPKPIYFSALLAAGSLTIRETLWHWLHQPP